jgi:uncharacterized protein (TIGR02453 family)
VSTGFPGFPPEAMQFFRGLARNNNRDWFLPRKPLFEDKVKRPMFELVDAVNGALKRFAPEYVTDPAKAVYRFYRDTRFSKDKTPYKDHIAASFRPRGLCDGGSAGYYFAVSHKEVAIGGGIYMPMPETLLAVRGHVADHHEQFRKLIRAKPLREQLGEMHGEQLTRVPKGFAAEHPAADLLRYKQFLFYIEMPPDPATTPQLYDDIVRRFRAMAPFLAFLNAPLARQKKTGGIPPSERLY